MTTLQNTENCQKQTMALREPKRKRRVRLRPRKPFPINIGSDNEWTMYTGHLSNLGVCITDPYEIQALHSMGFFGKGSLSRSYPNFERTRGGIPPVIRQRQWARRQAWLKQANNLDAQAFANDTNDEEWENVGQLDSDGKIFQDEQQAFGGEEQPNSVAENTKNNKKEESDRKEEVVKDDEAQNSDGNIPPPEKRFKYASTEMNECSEKTRSEGVGETQTLTETQGDADILITEAEEEISEANSKENMQTESHESHTKDKKSLDVKVDEVVLDSSEEEDEIREIPNIKATVPVAANASCDKEIILLNDEEMSVDLEEKEDNDETENDNKELNPEDEVEIMEREILVLPDSDSDVDDYLSQVEPRIEKEGFPVRETMYLTFEETFFLMFGLGCLQIVDFDGNLLNISDAWNHFCHTQNDFVQKYVVYHYFRSKGWVVKPGLKYGGDFLLYKQGPPFYHASYIVIVEVLEADTFIRDENKTTRKMTWKKLFGLDRLSETAAKEILFAQVLWPLKIPRSEIPSTPELLAEFTVKELLYRRWIPKQKREEIDLEDDDDELH